MSFANWEDLGYRITSPYGQRTDPFSKQKVHHNGIDMVRSNREVRAFFSGEVIASGTYPSGTGYGNYGNVVGIRDERGYTHVYAHLANVTVKIGDRVKVDQLIGIEGTTGKSTGIHLHYEVRRQGFGTDVNPTEYMLQYYKVENVPQWKLDGLKYMVDNLGLSDVWKATDTVDMGTLGTILSRMGVRK